MTAVAATNPAAAREGAAHARFHPLTFLVWILSLGTYEIYWYWVARRQVSAELERETSPLPGAAAMAVAWLIGVGLLVGTDNGVLQAVGLTIIPLGWAPVLHPLWNDINELRDRVGAPRFSALSYTVALCLPFLTLVVLHYPLKSLLFAFNPDFRAIVDAVGYVTLPAVPYTFGFVLGYLNEYWVERTAEAAGYRRFGLGEAGCALFGIAVIVVLAVS
ncbi:MAG: hypothetical protein QOJ07_690 [Thermoleophilaceae bacterium]|nr:hypothetical protein [Thermoleophilaceae bacterium]